MSFFSPVPFSNTFSRPSTSLSSSFSFVPSSSFLETDDTEFQDEINTISYNPSKLSVQVPTRSMTTPSRSLTTPSRSLTASAEKDSRQDVHYRATKEKYFRTLRVLPPKGKLSACPTRSISCPELSFPVTSSPPQDRPTPEDNSTRPRARSAPIPIPSQGSASQRSASRRVKSESGAHSHSDAYTLWYGDELNDDILSPSPSLGRSFVNACQFTFEP